MHVVRGVRPQPTADQLLLVRARLVQDEDDVEAVAFMCGKGSPGVNRLTAALIYVACGCSLRKCRRVVSDARMALRGHSTKHLHIYEQRLLDNAIIFAKRTTPGRQRKHTTRPS